MTDIIATTTRLTELETLIHAEIDGIVEKQTAVFRHFRSVGAALNEIRRDRLWIPKAANFNEYCETEFNFDNSRASQIITAATALQDFSLQLARASEDLAYEAALDEVRDDVNLADILPQNERQLRALIRVPRAYRVTVWQAVCLAAQYKTKNISAQLVDQCAESILRNQTTTTHEIIRDVAMGIRAKITKMFMQLNANDRYQLLQDLEKANEQSD